VDSITRSIRTIFILHVDDREEAVFLIGWDYVNREWDEELAYAKYLTAEEGRRCREIPREEAETLATKRGTSLPAEGDLETIRRRERKPTSNPDQQTTAGIIAVALGYHSEDELRAAGPEAAATRLANGLDIDLKTPEAKRVLEQTMGLVLWEADIVNNVAELVEETDRMAGKATPLDETFRKGAAEGFGLETHGDTVAAVYRLCAEVVRNLFVIVLHAHFPADWPLPV
jgi:hypothetical protein